MCKEVVAFRQVGTAMRSYLMVEQTQSGSVAQASKASQAGATVVSDQDREVLRQLAARVAELAAKPIEAENRERWYNLNALDEGRPVVFCDPENGWNEIIGDDDLQCADSLSRTWEMYLRKEIFWAESMGDDRVCEAQFPIFPAVAASQQWGLDREIKKRDTKGSYVWEGKLKSYDEDLPKLTVPFFKVDQAATEDLVHVASSIFGDLLEIKAKGAWWWSLGLTRDAIALRGLEQFLLDMCMEPDGLKALMQHLSDGSMAMLDQLEKDNLLSLNNDGTYVGSGGFGYSRELPLPDFSGHVTTRHMWGLCESQETVSVSPEQFEEFVFPYQVPIMERFGLNCYGCCEPLHLRWNSVKTFPNLRRVSISPWCDMEIMAKELTDQYVMSIKPNPAHLASPTIDEDFIRKSIREAFQITKGCRVEIIMKDNHTIGNNPQNVIDWCRIAKEEAEDI
jgi:hypothetical protein